MPELHYKEVSLSQLINDDITNYLKYFKNSSETAPILLFPIGLGKIATKCIRYHAAMYHLISFYVVVPENHTMIAVCTYAHLKKDYHKVYNRISTQTPEDSEIIYPRYLFNYTQTSILSMGSKQKRRTFGLNDMNMIAGLNTPMQYIVQKPENNKNFPQILNSPSSKSGETDKFMSITFSDGLDQFFKSYPTYHPSTLLEEQISDTTAKIYKFIEIKDSKSMGDTSISNPMDDSLSSVVQRLNPTPIEMIPLFTEINMTGHYDTLFFEYKYLIDQILECVDSFPLIVKSRNNYDLCKYISRGNLPSVIELYDIPVVYQTIDVLRAYELFGRSCVKWCDDTHAILIFAEQQCAYDALEYRHKFIKSRPIVNGSPIATLVGCMMDFPAIISHLRSKENRV